MMMSDEDTDGKWEYMPRLTCIQRFFIEGSYDHPRKRIALIGLEILAAALMLVHSATSWSDLLFGVFIK